MRSPIRFYYGDKGGWIRGVWELQITLFGKTFWLTQLYSYDWKWELPRVYTGIEDAYIILGPFGVWYNGHIPSWFWRHY